jgi:DNA excision repair protein ERCC-2
MEHSLFPFDEIRPIQSDMMDDVKSAIEAKQHLIAHAPTGLGKTAASLAPALEYAKKNGLRIFFLTSRHTQHHIAIETLKAIKNKHGTTITCADLIGKQWMCSQPNAGALYSNDFQDYCKKLREENQCDFYNNTKKPAGIPTLQAESALHQLGIQSPMHVEEVIEHCKKNKLCSYYTAELLSKKADVIIADYFYMFHPQIRDTFMNKIEADLEKSIIIVDEGHNLPKRCRELLSHNLTNAMIDRAIKEAQKYFLEEPEQLINRVKDALNQTAKVLEDKEESLVDKEDFQKPITEHEDYQSLIATLHDVADEIRKKQKNSYIGSIASFLEAWDGQDHGFTRIIQQKQGYDQNTLQLSYKCIDPSIVTKEVIERAHSIICMSGTITPTEMYSDILGFPQAREKQYPSPFSQENRLAITIPHTTTKYARRSPAEFEKMGKITADIANTVPGNTLIFFPSYAVRNSVYPFFQEWCQKETMIERQGLSKEDKQHILTRFKEHKALGAALLAVAAGSFGEGIDLPGDLLKCVIVVGIPLEKPSLEVKEVMSYYQDKYGRGLQYGYIFPAMIKTLQNAGRCIRSQQDRGAIIFLDERYQLPMYKECFPEEYNVQVLGDYKKGIQDFFDKQ